MRFLWLACFLMVFVAVHSDSSSESDSGSVECAGYFEDHECTSRESTCEKLGVRGGKGCVKSCICKKGFVRMNGVCEPRHKCLTTDAVAGAATTTNQVKREVTECADPEEMYLYCGSACPARCGDAPGSRVCAQVCKRGCFCKKGRVLNNKNKCVTPDKC